MRAVLPGFNYSADAIKAAEVEDIAGQKLLTKSQLALEWMVMVQGFYVGSPRIRYVNAFGSFMRNPLC